MITVLSRQRMAPPLRGPSRIVCIFCVYGTTYCMSEDLQITTFMTCGDIIEIILYGLLWICCTLVSIICKKIILHSYPFCILLCTLAEVQLFLSFISPSLTELHIMVASTTVIKYRPTYIRRPIGLVKEYAILKKREMEVEIMWTFSYLI